MDITREQVIEYLNRLGDPVDWSNWTLEQIRAEVIRGDDYDEMNIWDEILFYYGADDIEKETYHNQYTLNELNNL